MEALSGEFNEFYRRLKVVKDYHRRFPNEVVDPMDAEFLQLALDRQESVASACLPKRRCGRSDVPAWPNPRQSPSALFVSRAQSSTRCSRARRPTAGSWT